VVTNKQTVRETTVRTQLLRWPAADLVTGSVSAHLLS